MAHLSRRNTTSSAAGPEAEPTEPIVDAPSPLLDIIELNMDDPPDPPVEIDEPNIPPTEANIWEEVFHPHRYANHVQTQPSNQHSSTGSSQTKSASDNPDELNSISLVSISDAYINVDPTLHGLSEETILDAEELVEQVMNGKFVLIAYIFI